tara:strand:+ start:763 stop:1137 length:375 start_codon:yes stop_codon:yes gene_type:complete
MRDEKAFAKDIHDIITRSQEIFHEDSAETALVFLIDHLSDVCDEYEVFLEEVGDGYSANKGIMFNPKNPVCEVCKTKLDGEIPRAIMLEVEEETAGEGESYAHFVCYRCQNALEARSESKAKYN